MMTLSDLLEQIGHKAEFLIEDDPTCKMMRVWVNDICIMEGNYWDFHPGCHGGWHYEIPTWIGAQGLCRSIVSVMPPGSPVTIREKEYRYADAYD